MCEFTVISTAFIPTQQGNACDVITKLQKNCIFSKKKFLMAFHVLVVLLFTHVCLGEDRLKDECQHHYFCLISFMLC